MKWVTRERPKIDRIACPWLIARFIDREPEFLFVPPGEVRAAARDQSAIPYDVPDVELTHVGELCSFDAFLKKYRLDDAALAELAIIVRGADTARPELAAQAAGLLAISLGLVASLSRRSRDAATWHGDVRRTVCLVSACAWRDAHLESCGIGRLRTQRGVIDGYSRTDIGAATG